MDAMTLGREFERFQVVDVRYPNEWEAGHLDGAVHISGPTRLSGEGGFGFEEDVAVRAT